MSSAQPLAFVISLFLSLTVIGASPLSPSNWTIGQQVDTTSGPVLGHPASIHPEVSEYLGIPYATPPLGELRWTVPSPAKKSEKVLVADKHSADCPSAGALTKAGSGGNPGLPSALAAALGQIGHEFNEDCLKLNIWTKPQVGEQKKAVLVWIHGGGFTSGSANSPSYNGAVFAEKQDIVLVSINYRLNIFGFLPAPGLPDSNYGLYDQRLATQWVKDNIAAFGGDPSRITIFGESAGSRAVDIYAYAWATAPDPIVNGFISQSGGAPFTTGPMPNASLWYSVSAAAGCGGADKGEATVPCMRSRSMTDVLKAAGPRLNNFAPVVDDKTYFSDYEVRARDARFIHKPILIGNNDNEAGLFAALGSAGPPGASDPEATNLGYTCSSLVSATRRMAKGVHAFRYRWMGVFPNQVLTPTSGAWHGSEIPHVFGLPDGARNGSATESQRKVSELMNAAWAAFAKDPDYGLVWLGWPRFEADKDTLILLAEGNGPGYTLVKGDKYDAECKRVKNNIPGAMEIDKKAGAKSRL